MSFWGCFDWVRVFCSSFEVSWVWVFQKCPISKPDLLTHLYPFQGAWIRGLKRNGSKCHHKVGPLGPRKRKRTKNGQSCLPKGPKRLWVWTHLTVNKSREVYIFFPIVVQNLDYYKKFKQCSPVLVKDRLGWPASNYWQNEGLWGNEKLT